MPERAYLDWNATAPLRPEARVACIEALGLIGNPSSVHGEGRAVRRVIEAARAKVAVLVGTDPAQVIFTSGGTEANMLALTPMIEDGTSKQHRDLLLVSAIEHPSVSHGGRFPRHQVGEVPVTAAGVIDLDMLRRMLKPGASALVSVMLANNETGVIQPIREAADIVHEAGGLLHVDAVQGPGRIAFDIKALGADLLTLSAHKLGGPKGAGALVLREGLHIADPLIRGGGQERGARAGTENVAALAGFGAAAEAAAGSLEADAVRMAGLRDQLEAGVRARTPDAVIFGADAPRLPNTTLFAVAGMKAETAVIAFDLEGVAVSSGAACSSGKVQPSHVLAAMGVDKTLARGAVRVSLGALTTESQVGAFLKAWNKLSESLGKERRGIAA
ncbi:MAG: cysteine desulfurase family protein [Pseudorhodoplanes sp.]|jgi:cysteine desulfurase|nr:cysteine desulfurase family protein [Pseudorhodoplanes sp.]